MKRIITSILLVMSFTIGAQTTESDRIELAKPTHPIHKWQVGMTFSNIIMQTIPLDVSYRYNGNYGIGVNVSRVFGFTENTDATTLDDISSFSNRNFKGYEMAIYQKIYFYRTYSDNFFYIRHGLRGDRNIHTFTREDWFPIVNDGNTFLIFEERDFEEVSFRVGYDALVGFELYHGRISTDIFAGVAYFQQLSDNISRSSDINDPSYQGFRPVFGFRLAVNIGPTEYDVLY